MTQQREVKIYTTPTCHFCHMAKEFFKEHGIVFEEFDVAHDLQAREQMIEKSGQLGVPVITVGDEMVIGFDREHLGELLEIG